MGKEEGLKEYVTMNVEGDSNALGRVTTILRFDENVAICGSDEGVISFVDC